MHTIKNFFVSCILIFKGITSQPVVVQDPVNNPITAWLAANAIQSVSINAPSRTKGERRFDFFTMEEKRIKDYVTNVVPSTIALGIVDRNENRGKFVSKVHYYIRMGNTLNQIDEGDTKETRTAPNDFYKKLLAEKRIFHEFVIQATPQEIAQFKKFYEDFHAKNSFIYDIENGFGEIDEDNKMKLQCLTYSVLFAFPHLNKKYPLVQAVMERTNLHLFKKDPNKEPSDYPTQIDLKTFTDMLTYVTGSGVVTLGHKAESRGIPEGLHWRSFLDTSLVGKKFGVRYDQIEVLEPTIVPASPN